MQGIQGIGREAAIFLAAVLSGMYVKFGYQCLSCIRTFVHHSCRMIGIEDLIYWISTALYLFVQNYHTSNGSIRWYFILGLVLGVWVAAILIRKYEKWVKKIYSKKSCEKASKKL